MGDADGLDPSLLDPLAFDRRVERAARSVARTRRRLGHADLDDLPSPWAGHRAVSSKATVDGTKALVSDPLFAALRAWTVALTVDRVTFEDELAVARAAREARPEPELGHAPRSFDGLRDELLREPRESPRRATLAQVVARRGAFVQPIARHWFERRAEATRQLRAGSMAAMPAVRASDGEGAPPSAEALAGKVLAIVASSGVLPRDTSLAGLLEATLARDATEGWPAQLNVRWLARLFGDADLLRGVELDLEPEDLPPAIGGASFARALGAFGRALFTADVPRTRPFVLSRAPRDERGYARKWLFAMLPGSASFGRAHLSLGTDRARAQARSIARAFGVQAAFVALAATAELHVPLPERRARAAFEETTACAFGEPLDGSLVGSLPRARPSASADLAGLLIAARDAEQLRDTFDEDWFRNPRAHEALRHEHAKLAAPIAAPALESGLAALDRRIAEAVG